MPTLEWIGKEKVINHHQEVPFCVLERKYSYDENGQHDEDNGSENMKLKLVEKYPVGQYPLKELKENGLTSVQGRSKATVQLMKYLEK